MRIAIISKTPLAAAPLELSKALRKYTNHETRLINQSFGYNDGRTFPYELLLNSSNGTAIAACREAEVWHIHNYLFSPLPEIRTGQKILAQFHSVPRLGNWQVLEKFADACYTIAQPLQEREYRLPALPNIIDPDEYRPVRRDKKVAIAFAPSSRAPIHRPESKGYAEVRQTLDEVARERDVDIIWIEGVEYTENLRRKSRAHILIDDVVTGNWHRTSLEGACFGCVVMNRIDSPPFLYATLNTLKDRLLWMIDDKRAREDFQLRTRLWILQRWHAIDQVKKYVKAYEALFR